MTANTLKSYTLKDLCQLARQQGVRGWHGMCKDQLVLALLRTSSAPAAAAHPVSRLVAPLSRSSGKSATRRPKAARRLQPSRKAKAPRVLRRLQKAQAQQKSSKDLATKFALASTSGKAGAPIRDRVVAMVRDPFWLHVCWELTRQSIERVEAAMAQYWHSAKPVLRLLEVCKDATISNSDKLLRTIEVHGGVNNWYVDVQDPPKSYRLEIGYLADTGKFFALARSNVVTTPPADGSSPVDHNWSDVAENYDKIYAMSGGYSQEGSSWELQELFEERLRRPMGAPVIGRFGAGADGSRRRREFQFEVDAELIVFGKTQPDAYVTLRGEPVRLRADGSFTVRFSLPDKRQVLPVVASAQDGLEQRTIVLAVERNTKVMEPVVRDAND